MPYTHAPLPRARGSPDKFVRSPVAVLDAGVQLLPACPVVMMFFLNRYPTPPVPVVFDVLNRCPTPPSQPYWFCCSLKTGVQLLQASPTVFAAPPSQPYCFCCPLKTGVQLLQASPIVFCCASKPALSFLLFFTDRCPTPPSQPYCFLLCLQARPIVFAVLKDRCPTPPSQPYWFCCASKPALLFLLFFKDRSPTPPSQPCWLMFFRTSVQLLPPPPCFLFSSRSRCSIPPSRRGTRSGRACGSITGRSSCSTGTHFVLRRAA